MSAEVFRFKEFGVRHSGVTWKVGTDAILLGAWANVQDRSSILDAGCGTGVLMLMAAQRNPVAMISGIEIDKDTADVARMNIAGSPWGARLEVVCADVMSWVVPSDQRFEMLITNPPYFPYGKIPLDDRRRLARTGQGFYAGSLGALGARCLVDDGAIDVILPAFDAGYVIDLLKGEGWNVIRRCDVRHTPASRISRTMLEFERKNSRSTPEVEFLTLFEDGNPSERYQSLLYPFRDV